MEKPPAVEEKTREEVEAERKAKRAAKQERKKAALEKRRDDGARENRAKPEPGQLEAPEGDKPPKEPSKPKSEVSDSEP